MEYVTTSFGSADVPVLSAKFILNPEDVPEAHEPPNVAVISHPSLVANPLIPVLEIFDIPDALSVISLYPAVLKDAYATFPNDVDPVWLKSPFTRLLLLAGVAKHTWRLSDHRVLYLAIHLIENTADDMVAADVIEDVSKVKIDLIRKLNWLVVAVVSTYEQSSLVSEMKAELLVPAHAIIVDHVSFTHVRRTMPSHVVPPLAASGNAVSVENPKEYLVNRSRNIQSRKCIDHQIGANR